MLAIAGAIGITLAMASHRDNFGRQRGFFAAEEEDQYDIPTFLRKSVD